MRAYPLICKNPKKYKNHIIMISAFHVICAHFKMIGKKMGGTGLSNIQTEASLKTSGSLNGVLSGKLYSRVMTCHKTLLEALERMLLQTFLLTT